MRVTDKDFGLNKIMKEFDKLGSKVVNVGFMKGDMASDGKTTVAEVAACNEYGTDKIPSRPFVRNSFDATNGWTSDTEKIVGMVVDGVCNADKACNLLGNKAEGDIKKSITDGDYEKNAPSTVKHKGSNKPLIDTGRMRNSVKFEVKER